MICTLEPPPAVSCAARSGDSPGVPISIERSFDDSATDRLASDGFVIVDGWLGRKRALALRADLISLMDRGCFSPSRIGAGGQRHQASAIRGDSTCWFDAEASPEGNDGRSGVLPGAGVARFLAGMILLRDHLNRTCFLSLTGNECHAACYEPGSFYEAHLDNAVGQSRRVISFTHYLSERGDQEEGGCLRLHGEGTDHLDIEPLFDRLVVFRSRTVLHEVMPVLSRRLSMTGWMTA